MSKIDVIKLVETCPGEQIPIVIFSLSYMCPLVVVVALEEAVCLAWRTVSILDVLDAPFDLLESVGRGQPSGSALRDAMMRT